METEGFQSEQEEFLQLKGLEDTIIFISNAELDGFREGDGDLMDKITFSLNNVYHVPAIRIIMNDLNVPEDRHQLLENHQLYALTSIHENKQSETKEEKKEKMDRKEMQLMLVKEAQQKFLSFINSEQFNGKQKILYIGSRINIKDTGLLGESGSLFDEDFVRALKENNVKIVVCCLEYKFFKRAVKHLPKVYEMMKQQLFYADKIHFMTKPDKDDFLLTMKLLSTQNQLNPLEGALDKYSDVNEQQEILTEELLRAQKEKQMFTKASSIQRKKLLQEFSEMSIKLATLKKSSEILNAQIEQIQEELINLSNKDKSETISENKAETESSLSQNELPKKSSDSEEETMGFFSDFAQEKEETIEEKIQKLKISLEEKLQTLHDLPNQIEQFEMLVEDKEREIVEFNKSYDNGLIAEERKENDIKDKMALLKLPQFYQFENLHDSVFIDLEAKCCCIPGIYTVNPISISEVLPSSSEQNESIFLETLSNRPCNILQFGMIRGEKGVDEAIDLALKMQEMGLENKVIIAGKLMLDLGMVKNIFQKIFGLDAEEFYKQLSQALQNSQITEELLRPKEARQLSKVQNLITSEGIHEKFNSFCMGFYEKLANLHPECVTNIDIHFNVAEEELRELAMDCKYAIKLDHKGLAHNASTIVSCFGFYLPVFTTCGLCTNQEFLSFELSGQKIENTYAGVAIMLHPEFSTDNDFFEVRPKNPSPEQILNFLLEEQKHPERYMERLQTLHKLYQDKLYHCDNVTKLLLQECFIPLSLSKQYSSQFSIINK